MTSPLLTRAEAAAFCRCSVDAFDEHVRPHLPELRVGRRVLFRRADVEEWLQGPTPPRAPVPKPAPQLNAEELRALGRTLTRRQRVVLGIATPEEIEVDRILGPRRG